jgi:RNA polymerase sigma-70 factor (ECF subfamily)
MDDKDLLCLYKEGKRETAFNLIVKKYGERLYWHIRKMVICHEDADDLAQNTFVKAWHALPEFREESRLYTWLYRIATNEVLTFLKRKKLRNFISITEVSRQLENSLESDSFFNGDEVQKALHKAILKLPEKQRLVFNMRYFEEMKYEEMSEILGTSVGALKASYHHAHQKVQDAMEALL